MNINFKVRAKNPYFWVGLGGVILTAMGVSPETFTSWSVVWNQLVALVSNPFMLCSAVLAVMGVLVDPTTAGVVDSHLALTYTEPKKRK